MHVCKLFFISCRHSKQNYILCYNAQVCNSSYKHFDDLWKWDMCLFLFHNEQLIKWNQIIPHCWNNSKIKYQNHRKRSIDTPNTQIHDRLLSRLGTGTSITCGRVKLVLCGQASPLSEMMSSKCLPHAS
jgi:hypothetical protein